MPSVGSGAVIGSLPERDQPVSAPHGSNANTGTLSTASEMTRRQRSAHAAAARSTMVGKGALAFILNPTSFSATTTTADPAFGIITPRSAFLKRSFEQLCQPEYADEHKKRRVLLPKLSPIQDAPTSPLSVSWVPMPTSPASETGSSSSDEDAQVCDAKSGSKKKTTSCKVDGCSSLAVSRGCCSSFGILETAWSTKPSK
ncbi:TPA: hypothetical protein N0F65_009570 [Lagenidium giganteum]|uniref:Uncharacterized protein n=1 Tax=Lagenidium giganteum TaxID=4803 RepID=A0AAV2YRW4_9STRA|nr:TPA: hypothetical protein N0F65_009570 [Lagenidium giganteum]